MLYRFESLLAQAIQFFLLGLDNVRAMFGKPPLEHEDAVDVEVDSLEDSRK